MITCGHPYLAVLCLICLSGMLTLPYLAQCPANLYKCLINDLEIHNAIKRQQAPDDVVHSKKKSSLEHLFWSFKLLRVEDSVQYLEGPNSTWKD